MVAPEMTAPLGSVTIPEIPAATLACAGPLKLGTTRVQPQSNRGTVLGRNRRYHFCGLHFDGSTFIIPPEDCCLNSVPLRIISKRL